MSGTAQTMVRMGAIAVSAALDEQLVSLGLGSCIGVALVDAERRVAGLAHVMLPTSMTHAPSDGEGKFADQAVPRLIERTVRAGARRSRLAAVLAGGARMFDVDAGSGLDIGARNEAAVLESLAAAGIPVAASATRGSVGRTIRVYVGSGRVTVKETAGEERELLVAR